MAAFYLYSDLGPDLMVIGYLNHPCLRLFFEESELLLQCFDLIV